MRCSLVVLVICATSAWSFPKKTHRLTPFRNMKSRIINGQKAVEGQFPWQAGCWIDFSAFCGGALISERWVVTAGHCVDGARSFMIVLGTVDPYAVGSASSQDYVLHEEYLGDFAHDQIRNDIALIPLSKAVAFGANIGPIALSTEELLPSVDITVSGWGKTSDISMGISNALNFVSLETMTNDDCAKAFGAENLDVIHPEMVCANYSSEVVQSICSGDSGGPVVVYNETSTLLVAVVSFGSDQGCELGTPSGFTRIAYYADWFEYQTGV